MWRVSSNGFSLVNNAKSFANCGRYFKSYGNNPPCIAIRRETINPWERRAPLSPQNVKKLVKDGIKVYIQPSNRRAFTANEYIQAGAIVHEDISDCPIIIGVKQVPLGHKDLIPNKTYAFFSHTIKAQDENMQLLDAILDRNIRIIDYEKMLDERGQRVVAFGQFAGVAGMINILHGLGLRFLALGHHTPFMHIGPAHNYRSVGMARQAIRDAGYDISLGNMPPSIGPLIFVFTGTGNVSQGAQDMFMELPVEFVEPEHLQQVATKGATDKVYGCVISRSDHLIPKDGGKFDAEEFDAHPERYISIFSKEIAPWASVIINGIYYAPNAPRLLSIPDAKHLLSSPPKTNLLRENPGCPSLPHRLIAISDISADPGGSIEFMKECTKIDKPFCLYDAEENMSYEQFSGTGVLICSIDNMPAQLPRESTEFFGSLLLPYIPDILKSDAKKPFEQFQCSNVVKNAVIASNGKLTPNFEYIASLRQKKEDQKRILTVGQTSEKSVLILGSGHVVPPLIEYLVRDKKTRVTLASNDKAELLATVDKVPNTTPEIFDIKDTDRMGELIASHDLVVSMLPWKYHPQVMKKCIQMKRNLATASYCTPELRALEKDAIEAGITCLMEIGLDPGIDHMLAMECFDEAEEDGGRIIKYHSFTGGLPAPEFSENPLRYKFSWSPESALITATNPAKYIQNGKIKEISAGGDLMLNAFEMNMLPGFNLEGYPNRDSIVYQKLYGLEDCKNVMRGTLRFKGYTDAMWGIIQLGLLKNEPIPVFTESGPDITWKEAICEIMNFRKDVFTGTLKDAVFDKLGQDRVKFNCLDELGLFSDTVIEKKGTPLATFANYLAKTLSYRENERDVVIMTHEIGIQWPNSQVETRNVRLVVYGDPNGFLGMAKTVGIPTAIGCKMILSGEIQDKGVVLPLTKDIYRPMLKRMKDEGINVTESSKFGPL